MLGTERPQIYTKKAIDHLKAGAGRYEGRTSLLHRQLAIGICPARPDLGMAQLQSAESAAVLEGDLELAKEQAARAKKGVKRVDTPHWVKANDILQLSGQERRY